MSKRILFKKVATMHGKGEFAKIEGNIGNLPVEADTDFNVLPKHVNNNALVSIKLKGHLGK